MSIEGINAMDRREFLAAFGSLYEHSPWVAEGAYEGRPFVGFGDLHAAFVRTVRDASTGRRLDLIRAHPELAGKQAAAGELTAESSNEQTSAGLDRLSPQEYATLTVLNAAYKERFGFPMVVAVREHTKESIIAQAEARLRHTRSEEIETALREIDKIAGIRLKDLVESDRGGNQSGAGAR